MRRYILTITCPDRTGVVAAVTGFIADHGGWVLEAAQHGDLTTGRFFQRIEIIAETLPFGPHELDRRFASVGQEFDMAWRVTDTDVLPRVMILVSKAEHCLSDLLHRWRSHDLMCEITSVVSNHDDLRSIVEWHGIAYHHIPVPTDGKEAAFAHISALFDEQRADVMVLARFMQILPPEMCQRYAGRIINIHHSFLPSFVGAKPYHQAYEHGVKVIGATSHYVTGDLDQGPIIEQDTIRIDHADSVEELMRLGRDVEAQVLARALRWHLEDRVLVNGNRTVVFA
jgi:formyltetrahydrofolate deformylase